MTPTVFEQAHASLRRGGRLVCVGLPPETEGPMALPIFPTVLKGISVIGSIVGTRQDLAEVFELHARGRTRVVAETRKLDEINAVDRRRAGRTDHRPDRLRVLSDQEQGQGPASAWAAASVPKMPALTGVVSPTSTNCSRQPLFTWVIRHWRPR